MNNRDIARATGRQTYFGRPCKFGHNIRSTSSGHCHECALQTAELRKYKKVLRVTPTLTAQQKANRKVYQKDYHKNWVNNHKEQVANYRKEYYKNNKERRDQQTKDWMDANRDRRNEYMREYRKKNMGRYKEYYDTQQLKKDSKGEPNE